jgi:hypothetical protein
VLPECDAALFVVSPDPPITEVEINYLRRIQATVARLIIVLNKIDTVDPQDLAATVAFLRRVLAENAIIDEEVPVFLISARDALRAKMLVDDVGLATSRLPELEAYLGDFLARDKRAALESAVALKAITIIDQLLAETEIRLQALRLPMEDLNQRIESFDKALDRFNGERRVARDLLAGDRQRALEKIEVNAKELRRRARVALEAELDRTLARDGDVDAARNAILALVPVFFDAELDRMAASFSQHLTDVLEVHQERISDLVDFVRQTAADLMNVTLRDADHAKASEFRHEPYWVLSSRPETLLPIALGTFDRFHPKSIRKESIRMRLLIEIDTTVRRNVENLRWATRQNVEDALRRFGVALGDVLEDNLEATRGVLLVARDRRLNQADRVGTELAAIDASAVSLLKMQVVLGAMV